MRVKKRERREKEEHDQAERHGEGRTKMNDTPTQEELYAEATEARVEYEDAVKEWQELIYSTNRFHPMNRITAARRRIQIARSTSDIYLADWTI